MMLSHDYDHDVLVVGAGPAGSHAAYCLAEAGHSVSLLDENDGPRCDIICSGIVSLEAFEKFGLPTESVLHTVEGASFHSPSGLTVNYRPSSPLAYVVDRGMFDVALTQRAAAAGAVLRRDHAARGIHRSGNLTEVEVEVDGRTQTLRARAVVVATGHRRWLCSDAGLGSAPGYVHGVHAEVTFDDLADAELYFGNQLAPGFFAWAVPMGPEIARLGLLVPQGGRESIRRFFEHPSIASRIDSSDGKGRLQSRGIVQGTASPTFADNVIAVGEAAGQIKTTTGGGIYYGMIGAEIAAEVLCDCLRTNQLSAPDLAPYEERWLELIGSEIEKGLELQALADELGDSEIDALFAAMQNGVASAMKRVVEFDWHRGALKLLIGKHHDRHEVLRRALEKVKR